MRSGARALRALATGGLLLHLALAGCSTATEVPAPSSDPSCPDVVALLHDTCGVPGCHSAADKTPGLDLQSPNVAARLVGVASNDGGLLIDPSMPSKSVLYTKLTPTPPFGMRMPLGKARFDDATMTCVLSWVSQQKASADAGAAD